MEAGAVLRSIMIEVYCVDWSKLNNKIASLGLTIEYAFMMQARMRRRKSVAVQVGERTYV